MSEPNEHEIQILEEIAGLKPASPWGAWVGECLEGLYGAGYITRGYGDGIGGALTQKGKDFLASLRSEKERG